MNQPGEITMLLRQADQGDCDAVSRLFGLVERDLKAIARKRKRSAPTSNDASTTVLVDEAFYRLVGKQATAWEPGDRRKFFGYVSKKIHDMLIKAARAEAAAKRGGGRQLDDFGPDDAVQESGAANLDLLLDLQAALDKFEQFAPEEALGFRLRYFLGCTFEEVAEVLGVSPTQAKRGQDQAKLWLRRELKVYDLGG
jgi:RNA polymerase sigma factor (TIGR02999 family)